MKDLISIIIPCYNAAKTISRTLNSIREQDFKDVEVIVVNDGSKDNSLEVLSMFEKVDRRIKVVTQENAGVSVARNNGLKHAKGNYIVYLDADDNYTTPYALSNMMRRLKETGSDMVVCKFIHPCFEQHLDAGVYDLTNKKGFMAYIQDFFTSSMPWNRITKRECITEEYIPGVKFTEDEIFNLYNLKNVKKVVVMDEVYHNYYCAPYNPYSNNNSAVNSQSTAETTLWKAGMGTYGYRMHAINNFYPDMKVDLQYIRSFDFFFWDFFLNAKNRMPEEHIFNVCKRNMSEDLFQRTLKDKERFGLRLKDYTENDIKTFVKLAYYAFRDIKSYNKKLSMLKVFLGLFGKFFYDLSERIDTSDILAEACLRRLDKSSAESIYVNSLLDMNEIEVNENTCRIILFDNNMASWRGEGMLLRGDGVKEN